LLQNERKNDSKNAKEIISNVSKEEEAASAAEKEFHR
jgi:hypothetical protein